MIRKMKLFHQPDYILLCQKISSYMYFLNLYFFKPNMEGFAITCLGVSTYLFHQKNYHILKYNKPSVELVPYSIADIFCIHLRCIASYSRLYSALYSVPLHIISFVIVKDPEYSFITSAFIVEALNPSLHFNHFIFLYVLSLVLYIKPFRHMNVVFFYILLFIQNFNQLT